MLFRSEIFHFARPIPELSIITKHMMEMIYGWYHHLLSRCNHILPSPHAKAFPQRPKYREKSSRPAVLKRLQIAATNVVECGATTLRPLMGRRRRQVTKFNVVVGQKSSLRKLILKTSRTKTTIMMIILLFLRHF